MPATLTNHLTVSDLQSIVADNARAELREGIAAHLARRRAARILDEHALERKAIRAAARDANAGTALERAGAARVNVQALAAARRDQYRKALAYPMTPGEVLTAVRQACDAARLPDDDERAETTSELVRVVLRRHGKTPLRCDVGTEWLRQWAKRIYMREVGKREHRTGMRAAAAELGNWQNSDLAAAIEAGDHSPDRVYWRAMNMPAPAETERPESAAELAYAYRERLALTARQAEALAVALQSHQRVTVVLSGSERKAAADARRILRKRFPEPWEVLAALHRRMIVDAAISGAAARLRARAAVAVLGSHLPATRPSASTLPLARIKRPAPAPAPGPHRVEGETRWVGHGNGYSGACSVLYLYRGGQRRAAPTT